MRLQLKWNLHFLPVISTCEIGKTLVKTLFDTI